MPVAARAAALLCVTACALALMHPLGTTSADAHPPLTWEAEWGGFNSIVDLALLPDGRIFAVGSNLVVGDGIEPGARWRAVDGRDIPASYGSLDLVDGTGWAVGRACIQRIESGEPLGCVGSDLRLDDIALTHADEGWAVGSTAEGVYGFVRVSEGDFRFYQEAQEGYPRSLWVHESGEGWATAKGNQLYHLVDGAWSTVSTPATRTLTLVGGLAPDDLWAASGQRPGPPPLSPPEWNLVHFDGEAWRVIDGGFGYGFAALGMGHGTGYLVGWNGALHRLEDGVWRSLGISVPANRFQTVSAVEVLADGSGIVATEAGGVYHVIERSVHELFAPREKTGIWLAGDRGWVVDGFAALERGTDGLWRPVPEQSALHPLRNLDGAAPDDAWGVGGNGLIMHFDGQTWSSVASPTDVNLTRVRAVSPDLAWAVGAEVDSGTIHSVVLRYDGAEWSLLWERRGGYDTLIIDATGTAPEDPWVVSGNRVWRLREGSWMEAGPDLSLWSLDATDAGIWAGTDGALLRHTDTGWVPELRLPAGSQIHGLRMRHGLLAAWYGAVFHRTAGIWHRHRGSPDPASTYGVPPKLGEVLLAPEGSPDAGSIFAVGAQSSILREVSADEDTVREATPTPPTGKGRAARLFLPSLHLPPESFNPQHDPRARPIGTHTEVR